MKRQALVICMVAGFATGCAQQSSAPEGNAALGIAEFKVVVSAKEVQIFGLDESGALVGEALYAEGSVNIPLEGLAGDGRTLTVAVDGRQVEHASVGMDERVLPLPHGDGAALATFLQDPHVAPMLAARGLRFTAENPTAAPQSSGERPYNSCSYVFNASCGEINCCQYGFGTVYEDVCCAGVSQLVNRSCSSTRSSACGPNGSGGCAVCWTESYTSSCNTTSCGIGGCGWMVDGADQGEDGCTPNCGSNPGCGQKDGCGGQCNGFCGQGSFCTQNGQGLCGPTYDCQ